MSHQLRLLRSVGLVTLERHGGSITYSLDDDHVASLLDEAVYHAERVRLGDTESESRQMLVDGGAGKAAPTRG